MDRGNEKEEDELTPLLPASFEEGEEAEDKENVPPPDTTNATSPLSSVMMMKQIRMDPDYEKFEVCVGEFTEEEKNFLIRTGQMKLVGGEWMDVSTLTESDFANLSIDEEKSNTFTITKNDGTFDVTTEESITTVVVEEMEEQGGGEAHEDKKDEEVELVEQGGGERYEDKNDEEVELVEQGGGERHEDEEVELVEQGGGERHEDEEVELVEQRGGERHEEKNDEEVELVELEHANVSASVSSCGMSHHGGTPMRLRSSCVGKQKEMCMDVSLASCNLFEVKTPKRMSTRKQSILGERGHGQMDISLASCNVFDTPKPVLVPIPMDGKTKTPAKTPASSKEGEQLDVSLGSCYFLKTPKTPLGSVTATLGKQMSLREKAQLNVSLASCNLFATPPPPPRRVSLRIQHKLHENLGPSSPIMFSTPKGIPVSLHEENIEEEHEEVDVSLASCNFFETPKVSISVPTKQELNEVDVSFASCNLFETPQREPIAMQKSEEEQAEISKCLSNTDLQPDTDIHEEEAEAGDMNSEENAEPQALATQEEKEKEVPIAKQPEPEMDVTFCNIFDERLFEEKFPTPMKVSGSLTSQVDTDQENMENVTIAHAESQENNVEHIVMKISSKPSNETPAAKVSAAVSANSPATPCLRKLQPDLDTSLGFRDFFKTPTRPVPKRHSCVNREANLDVSLASSNIFRTPIHPQPKAVAQPQASSSPANAKLSSVSKVKINMDVSLGPCNLFDAKTPGKRNSVTHQVGEAVSGSKTVMPRSPVVTKGTRASIKEQSQLASARPSLSTSFNLFEVSTPLLESSPDVANQSPALIEFSTPKTHPKPKTPLKREASFVRTPLRQQEEGNANESMNLLKLDDSQSHSRVNSPSKPLIKLSVVKSRPSISSGVNKSIDLLKFEEDEAQLQNSGSKASRPQPIVSERNMGKIGKNRDDFDSTFEIVAHLVDDEQGNSASQEKPRAAVVQSPVMSSSQGNAKTPLKSKRLMELKSHGTFMSPSPPRPRPKPVSTSPAFKTPPPPRTPKSPQVGGSLKRKSMKFAYVPSKVDSGLRKTPGPGGVGSLGLDSPVADYIHSKVVPSPFRKITGIPSRNAGMAQKPTDWRRASASTLIPRPSLAGSSRFNSRLSQNQQGSGENKFKKQEYTGSKAILLSNASFAETQRKQNYVVTRHAGKRDENIDVSLVQADVVPKKFIPSKVPTSP